MDSTFFNFFLLIVGLLCLVKGADFLVNGAGSIAKKWGVSPLVIGLTIVAFGTSAPEFFVNVISSIKGASGITIGNVIGSNLANPLLGIGIIAVMRTVYIQKTTVWKEIPFLLLSTFLLWVAASDHILDGAANPSISRSEAFMFLALFMIFIVYTLGIAKSSEEEEGEVTLYPLRKSVLLFFLGLAGLTIGGEVVVRSASEIARNFGLSETFIGITLVALGTSIPDIVTTIVAARKNNMGIAVGNIIGSNIFNILWILGISALIRPIPLERDIQIDLLFLVFTVLLLFVFQMTYFHRRYHTSFFRIFSFRALPHHEIDFWEGVIFIALYVLYMISLVLRVGI